MQRRYENATSLYMVTCCLTSNLNIYLCAQPFNCLEHILKDRQSCMCLSLEILCLHNNILVCPQPYNFCTYKSILHGLVPCKHLQIIVFYMPPNSSVQQIRYVWNNFQLITSYISVGLHARRGRPCRPKFIQPSGLRSSGLAGFEPISFVLLLLLIPT